MTLKTPDFWYRANDSKAPLMEKALLPFSAVYHLLFNIHQKISSAYKAPIPVLCIGNITAGGTGKTPTAIALMATIKKHEMANAPFFLIRGYGGAQVGPTLVDVDIHNSWDVGDEALILAQYAPTIVGPDRAASAQLALKHGADMLVMDDGLQNPGIEKDIKFVVVNGEMGFGNGQLMPAGPMRQTLNKGSAMADGFILIGKDERDTTESLPNEKPFIHAKLKPTGGCHIDKSLKYLAFAGLGYPNKFFNFLRNTLDLDVAETIAFSDHYPYEDNDIKALHKKAEALGATLITTEKDFTRIPKIKGIDIQTLPVEMVWSDESALVSLLQNKLKS